MSRALARLEIEVGTPLLRRSGRTLRMTHAGSAFKRHVDAMLFQLDDGLAAVNQLIEPETGTVSLAFELSLGTWLVPDLVSSFRTDHPHVQFELKVVPDELASSVPGRGWLTSRSRPSGPRTQPCDNDESCWSSRCGWRCRACIRSDGERGSIWPRCHRSRSSCCGRHLCCVNCVRTCATAPASGQPWA